VEWNNYLSLSDHTQSVDPNPNRGVGKVHICIAVYRCVGPALPIPPKLWHMCAAGFQVLGVLN
jgi:hypothetical protein